MNPFQDLLCVAQIIAIARLPIWMGEVGHNLPFIYSGLPME